MKYITAFFDALDEMFCAPFEAMIVDWYATDDEWLEYYGYDDEWDI